MGAVVVRLADDDRARVPFALLGVLLLLGSTAFAATLATRGPGRQSHAVGRAVDRVEAGSSTAIRTAVVNASRWTARNPVTEPANTSAGRVLNDSTPVRDELRIRIYLAARDALGRTGYRQSGISANATLPPINSVDDLRTAKRRVRIESLSNGTRLRVTIRNVTVRVRRADRRAATTGEPITEIREPVTVVVSTPIIAARDATERYERRLNRGPLAGPGLGRRLTARLYPVAWARGYAQYSGAPIENVIANRHVELTTNGGIVATQRAVFGRSDPAARRGLTRATAAIGVKDLAAAGVIKSNEWLNTTLPPPIPSPSQGTSPRLLASGGPSPNRSLTVNASDAADVGFTRLLDGNDTESLDGVLRDTYRVEAHLRTRVRHVHVESMPAPHAPGENWTLIGQNATHRETVDTAPSAAPGASGGRSFARYGRRVVDRGYVVRTWQNGNRTRRTDAQWTNRYRVGVAVVGHYRPTSNAPSRRVQPRYRRGGALDGPNLADVSKEARQRLLASEGGRDAVARRAVDGSLGRTHAVVYGRRPDRLNEWATHDVLALGQRVRNVSVTVRAGAVATGDANPAAKLAERLRERRTALLDAPDEYHGVADRARVAARVAYLDSVIATLERRANQTQNANRGLDDALRDADVGSAARAGRILRSRRRVQAPTRRKFGGDGPTGSVTLVPDGAPSYLTLAAVDHDHVASLPRGATYRPLVARNRNYFTVPYGDAADTVVGSLFSSDRRVSLRTAGETLVAANRTLARTDNATLRRRRDVLRRAVAKSLDRVRERTRRILAVRIGLSGSARRAAVRGAMDRRDGVGRRAVAVDNGSFAAAVAGEVRAKVNAKAARGTETARSAIDAGQLRVRLRVGIARTTRERNVRVPRTATNRTASAVRDTATFVVGHYATAALGNATERAKRRYLGETLGELPAGLPVLPVPGYWYATVNVWSVAVRGTYQRFTVRVREGVPDGGGAALQYVRDGSVVHLDVDGDGSAERLGRDSRISFETRTLVVVAVPPGERGVGDTNGDADEVSSGWPDPGCTATSRNCRTGSVKRSQ